MVQQDEPKLDEAQIAAIGTVDPAQPVVAMGKRTEVDDPEVGQTSRQQQARQARWTGPMALLQVKAAT